MLRTFMISLVVLTVSAVAVSGESLADPASGYSFTPPRNWTVVESNGGKSAVGPAEAGFRPSLGLTSQSFVGTLSEFIKTNLEGLLAYDPEAEVVGRNALKTDAGMVVLKVIVKTGTAELPLRQSFYFFAGRTGTYHLLTGSAAAETKDALDAVFDAAVKSLKSK